MTRGYLAFVMWILTMRFVLVKSQNKTAGFINLDCGLSPYESPYEDPVTHLIYTTDADFIQSNSTQRGRVDKAFESAYTKPCWNLRFFPKGKRNCYQINVTQDTQYLIRATFVYGNYDGVNVIPSFDLYLGPNIWTKVINASDLLEEVIHFTRSKYIQVCLVDIGSGTPFLNVLELRPLHPEAYRTSSGSLKSLLRFYLSNSATTSYIRYPDDVYDRYWYHSFKEKLWTLTITDLSVNTSSKYNPPEKVMKTAATPVDANATLEVEWTVESPTTQFYPYTYVSELQTLQGNDTREFSVKLNGEYFNGPILPKPLVANTVSHSYPLPNQCTDGKCVLQLTKTSRSILPPILSAFEVYTVMDIPQLETNDDDFNGIKDVQGTYNLRRITWQGDPCVPKQFLWEGLNCNHSDNSTPPTIISLDLSSSGLTGVIAEAIQSLAHLQKLDLSNNSLSGGVPDFLANMKSLFLINLSGNNLSGSVPQMLVQKKGIKLNVEGNPLLICTTGPCAKKEEKFGTDHLKDIVVPVSIAVVVASLALLLTALILFFLCRQKRSPSVEGPPSNVQEPDGLSASSELTVTTRVTRFTYSQVTSMTNNFQIVIGEGGFGNVYLGFVNGAEQVAVKILSHSSSQGYRQFKAEVQLLLRVHHKNLVGLVGYCDEGEHLALIYEYMANGDLKEHMSGRARNNFIMNWGNRLKIATESAQGLEYLHSGCTPAMVHRDVKTSNILLSDHFEAKVADFGLSRSFPTKGESHVSTVVAGTPGYLDPEYYRTGRLTTKTDVYSFGVLLLELLTNQAVVDQSREKPHIGGWVEVKLTNGDINSIMDPRLNGNYHSDSAWQSLELAMACLNPSSSERPTMSQVVYGLKQCLTSELSRAGPSQDMDNSTDIEIEPAAR